MTSNIQQLMAELNGFIAQDGVNDAEKQWAQQQTTDPDLRQALKQLSTADIKLITQLTLAPATHAKDLPIPTGLSQATVSRGLTKLAKLALAEKFRSLQNNKEVLVRLTTKGQAIAQLHTQLDDALAAQITTIAADYTPAELARFTTLMRRIREIKP
ncbi:MarR family transcriptional regulator [Lactobacillus sp.] [Lactiplantibacillus mudanjiangensis]|uniref:MarR family winged helix-turn-helix transcriptional regulator n=1 Tax=Lactiplantibacillus mudanjiangensis TaxID=1296538 RepID=UPI001015AD25|nr:MarR family transcriptional regulator [Lactiplantibacillus mudanjiangensis]VDG31861.1 MarR family transcriptional regulator [Lactobacillus sp.] [Lactiplantibacillus mudanjiangensis]